MSNLTHALIDFILNKYNSDGPKTPTFVETGTGHGKTTTIAAISGFFKQIHTIEKSPKVYYQTLKKLGGKEGPNGKLVDGMAQRLGVSVGFHLGDSTTTLPVVISSLPDEYRQAPIFFYLDAHYCDDNEYPRETNEELPIWKELEVLCQRKYPDIVVINDFHMFGKSKQDIASDMHRTHPEKYEVWENVTVDTIRSFISEKTETEIASERLDIVGDQLVIFMPDRR